jgi:hypothetical protein
LTCLTDAIREELGGTYSITVTPEDRLRLEAIVGDRNAKQKHVKRAKVILATADGCGTNEIMRRSELSKPVVSHSVVSPMSPA